MFFRTCAREKGHLVLQIGTSCGDRAALVAKKMEQGQFLTVKPPVFNLIPMI
jgi:hypothetical protein